MKAPHSVRRACPFDFVRRSKIDDVKGQSSGFYGGLDRDLRVATSDGRVTSDIRRTGRSKWHQVKVFVENHPHARFNDETDS